MMKQILLFLGAVILAGCSRSPAVVGLYESQGSQDKFKLTLEVRADGTGKFAAHSNLGDPKLDRAVEAVMTIPEGRWVLDGANLVLSGKQGDGKPVAHRFVVQKNGELFWDKNGARLVKVP